MLKLLRVLPAILIATLTVGPVSAATASLANQTIAQANASSPPAPPTSPASVSGIVTDSTGGPVVNADILMAGPGSYETHTDAKGHFNFNGVKPGLYRIAITKPGYGAATQEDVAIGPGVASSVNATMVPSSLQSLRLIGTVSTSAGNRAFNASGLSVTTLSSQQITDRVQPNLKNLLNEVAGVEATQDSGSRTPNSSWMVRGANVETKVTIDGHAVTSGVFGTYNNNYSNSEIFEQAEIVKGAGLNGPNGGESGFGTVNLRTRNFSEKNELYADVTGDGYGAGYYQFRINQNFLNNKLTVLAAQSFQGYLGPNQAYPVAYNINTLGGTNSPGYAGPTLIQWQNSLQDPYATKATLFKARYRFSQATNLSAEYLNSTGRYYNQGGSYAYNYLPLTIAQCYNGAAKTFGSGAACTTSSTYNPPWLTSLVGTQPKLFNYFPNSYVLNQEPQYSAELRTTWKNDTIFLRPYQTYIKRFIDGTFEDYTPGYASFAASPPGWYMVTNTANCSPTFGGAAKGPGATGYVGPCFVTTAGGPGLPYTGAPNPTKPPVFPTTTTAPKCGDGKLGNPSPCWTTPTNVQRNGYIGFNTPFSQPETDRLSGATFSWVHPVKDNLYNFALDFNRDNTLRFSGDISTLPTGCFNTAGAAPNPAVVWDGGTGTKPNPYYQPACQIGGAIFANTPKTGLQIPPTTSYKYDWSLTGLWQLNPRLQVGLGNYLSWDGIDSVATDPGQIAASANTFVAVPDPLNPGKFKQCDPTKGGCSLSGAENADTTLVHTWTTHVHYDPHLQVQYRLNHDASLRLTAGSATTFPYNGQVSGFVQLSPNGAPDGATDNLRVPNASLLPETTVAFDVGGDFRLRDGAVISTDLFNNTIFNVFTSITTQVPNLPGRAPSQTLSSQTINGPLQRDYGMELGINKTVQSGWGYRASATAQRAYYDNFSDQFYATLAQPYVQAVSKQVSLGKLPVGTQAEVCGYQKYSTKIAPCIPLLGVVNGKQLDGQTGFTGQVPYMKGSAEANYAWPHSTARASFGGVYQGANNPWGGAWFATFYANASIQIANGVELHVAGENIFDYSVGGLGIFTGQVINNGGFWPIGTAWSAQCKCMRQGNFNTFPDSLTVVPPANIYIGLSFRR
ncbi:MAG: carboxypeptidase regulatory-like domain-containing protein [Candidatus Baltobacteraceae bacterium]